MNFHKTYQVGPKNTPKVIKSLIALTTIFSILCAVIPNLHLFYFLGLSLPAIKQGFFWQLVTNLLIIPNQTISFGFVFHLVFNLYLLWVLGTAIIDLRGQKHFLYLFFISGILSSSVTLLVPSYSIFAGANIPLYSLAIAWMMLHKDAKLLLFFSLPIKATWLILGIMALNLLSLLSSASFDYFLGYVSSALISYFFAVIAWKTRSPFSFLSSFERFLLRFFKRKKSFSHAKIYDFKTKKPVQSDEEFMDAMLHKISLHGEDSLTKKEKRRMQKISKKR